jgi:hypothetical protein
MSRLVPRRSRPTPGALMVCRSCRHFRPFERGGEMGVCEFRPSHSEHATNGCQHWRRR